MIASDQQRVNFWRSAWRPFVAVIGAICLFMIVFTVCMMLVLSLTKFDQASAVLVAMVGSICTMLTAFIAGRSYEKARGQSIPPNELHNEEFVEPGLDVGEIQVEGAHGPSGLRVG